MKTRFTADELENLTRQELYLLSQELEIKGRAKLAKEQLIVALKPFADQSPGNPSPSVAKRGRPPKTPDFESLKNSKVAVPAKIVEPAKSAKKNKIAEPAKVLEPAKSAKISEPVQKVTPAAKRGRPPKNAESAKKSKTAGPAKIVEPAKSAKINKIASPAKVLEPAKISESIQKATPAAKRGRPPKNAGSAVLPSTTRAAIAEPEKKSKTTEPAKKAESKAALPDPTSAVDKFNKDCEDEIAALKHLNRAFGKKTDSAPSPRSKKGVEIIGHALATPVEFHTRAEETRVSKKAEQIENERRKKHASLKTTMEIPIFSAPSHDHFVTISETELTGELPEEYGETRIVLQVRDPHWAYAYWELPLIERKRLELEVGIFEFAHSHFVLKLHNVSLGHSQEIKLSENARNWYLYLENAQTVYQVELGMQSPVEGYTFISLSNLVQTPPDQVSERWAEAVLPEPPQSEIDNHVAADEVVSPAEVLFPETAHLTDPAQVYFTSLHGDPLPHPGSSDLLAGQRLLPPAMPSSQHAPQLPEMSSYNLPGAFHLEMPSSPVASAFMPTSPMFVQPSWSSSDTVSSFSGRPEPSEELFLSAAVDLIIYGNVAGGCSLSFMGQPLKVRPDGSYSLRLALPLDAEQQIELTAVDPVTKKQRTIKARIIFNHQ